MHLADAFIQSDLFLFRQYIFLCVPWELNPQPFALLTQCSTTEPQEHDMHDIHTHIYTCIKGKNSENSNIVQYYYNLK